MTDWIINHPSIVFFTCSALASFLACVYVAMRSPISFFKFWLPILGWGIWFLTWIPLVTYPSTPAAQAPVLPAFFIALLTTLISRDYARKRELKPTQNNTAPKDTESQIEILKKLDFIHSDLRSAIGDSIPILDAILNHLKKYPSADAFEPSARFIDPSGNPSPPHSPNSPSSSQKQSSGLYVGDAHE